MTEERTIKGEVEGWAANAREFGKNNKGSRGIKVEGDWHNIVGTIEDLKTLDQTFPKGTFVEFVEKKNQRGYWDIEGEIKKIEKSEAYNGTEPPKTAPSSQNDNKSKRAMALSYAKDLAVADKIEMNELLVKAQVMFEFIQEGYSGDLPETATGEEKVE